MSNDRYRDRNGNYGHNRNGNYGHSRNRNSRRYQNQRNNVDFVTLLASLFAGLGKLIWFIVWIPWMILLVIASILMSPLSHKVSRTIGHVRQGDSNQYNRSRQKNNYRRY